ncbi:precorrin-2 dehydrogenase/sirohydrochlorin ferrochelatase family protein [Arenibaculum pallidiluteum]|uniref:precorrin-2 dehydrogenase/sirohydrochlorin ferrochelatase family protein n=1 Tax=Arenibaculum pallidiluteum TaxID=2812559 RepID=UPI002E27F513|nr:NAD(P)-dependent oxidoreductase [Arenibaculum pallidiluteum]
MDETPRLMVPLVLDPVRVRIGLAGGGPLLARRLAWLRDGGGDPAVYAPAPDAELEALAGPALRRRLPDPAETAALQVLWVAGLAEPEAERLAAQARALGVLVNVEDVMPLCDFHTPSVVRRGSLLLTVSTGGKSPGLAAKLRRYLEALFPAEWTERVEQSARARRGWRAEGLDGRTTAELTGAMARDRGWLP